VRTPTVTIDAISSGHQRRSPSDAAAPTAQVKASASTARSPALGSMLLVPRMTTAVSAAPRATSPGVGGDEFSRNDMRES
jgi:hypothetical protein